MSKDTVSLTFNSRIPYTVTRDARLTDGTIVPGVKVAITHVYRNKETREYDVEAFYVVLPKGVELNDEQRAEIYDAVDNFVLRLAHWLEGRGHIAHRVSTEVRNDDILSL